MPMSPRLLRPRASGLVLPSDADARAYVLAVNTADGQPLEAPVVQAIDAFVVGCKADGIWSAIKASCILMGARTLSGALTPLAGAAPTNNNFVAGNYNRKTGLVGNGTTKYLNSNRSTTADGQNDVHLAVYQSAAASSAADVFMAHIGAVQLSPSVVGTHIAEGFIGANSLKVRRCRSVGSGFPNKTSTNNANGLQGISRSSSASYIFRAGAVDTTISEASASQSSHNYFVFAQNNDGTVSSYSNARIAFYSIGSSLTLSLLDTRLATLYTAIGAAIP